MRVFHGTTADKLEEIRANGLSIDAGGENWTVSGSYVYFWSPDEMVNLQESEEDYAREDAFNRAFENAQFGLGFSSDCRAVVIEAEIDESELETDESCPNMNGAMRIARNVLPAEFVSMKISSDLSLLRGWFISYCLERDLSARFLSELEEKIAKKMKGLEIYSEEIQDMVQWEEIK